MPWMPGALGFDETRSPRRPVLEHRPADHVLSREEAPDMRVQAVVPVIAQDHHHPLRYLLGPPPVFRFLRAVGPGAGEECARSKTSMEQGSPVLIRT